MTSKKNKLTKKQLKFVQQVVDKKLAGTNLKPWQEACKSLAPPNYDTITRSQWFMENKSRAEIGREIVEFVTTTIKDLKGNDDFTQVPISLLTSAVVKGIRIVEEKQGISKYLLNEVKLSTLRTIVTWTDEPKKMSRIRDGPKRIGRRGRKKEKGKHRPPHVNIVKEWAIIDEDSLRITSALSNNYIHPYQNVELEIDFGPNLIVKRVSPYHWLPDEKKIRIGFLEASLDVEDLETIFTCDLTIRNRIQKYSISYCVHFDNCDKGIQEVTEKEKIAINLF